MGSLALGRAKLYILFSSLSVYEYINVYPEYCTEYKVVVVVVVVTSGSGNYSSTVARASHVGQR